MKRVALLALSASLLANMAYGNDLKAADQRTQPVGQVNVAGQPAQSATAAAAPAAAKSGEEIYLTKCAVCHTSGAAGAPKIGDKNAWSARMKQGEAKLVMNAIKGIRAMPPRGGCAQCTDDDIKASVKHMIDQSK